MLLFLKKTKTNKNAYSQTGGGQTRKTQRKQTKGKNPNLQKSLEWLKQSNIWNVADAAN